VPEASWGDVQAVNWFCEDAGWDVLAHEPFTPACMGDVWPGGGEGGGGGTDGVGVGIGGGGGEPLGRMMMSLPDW
jgi:hypothetical protein